MQYTIQFYGSYRIPLHTKADSLSNAKLVIELVAQDLGSHYFYASVFEDTPEAKAAAHYTIGDASREVKERT
jgi:hypothetical protein